MTVKTGQAWAGLFVTLDATGAKAASADAAGTLYVDGVADAATVTITGSNPYKWAVTLPALTAGQRVDMYITGTIGTIATAGIVASAQADTRLLSDGVTLADDAITASKFDESTAFPVKSADTGATAIARVGADSDTLETLSDQIDGAALEATLTAIKGAGWTTETLVVIKALVDAIKVKTDLIPASPAQAGEYTAAIAAVQADLDNPDQYKADVSAITGASLSAAGIDAILDEVVVGSYTMRQLLKVMAAALAGKATGGGTTAVTFRGVDDTSDVIVATVDANGNRSAVTLTV